MNFSDKVKGGNFVITSEIGPPKGVDLADTFREVDFLKNKVDAINVTDLQSSVMRLGSLGFCRLLLEKGVEPIFQITCRDRNRLALQSDCLSAYALGIRNVLVLTGDHPAQGDHPQAKPVFDLDSVQLISALKTLENGFDMAGKKLKGAPKFFIAAAVNPESDPLEPQIVKMEKKVAAGAQFFQTQAIFDIEKFKIFREKSRHLKIPVHAGVMLLKSEKTARFINQHVPGICIPDSIIQRFEKASDKVQECINLAAELVKELKGLCEGIHFMPLGWSDKLPLILERAGLE